MRNTDYISSGEEKSFRLDGNKGVFTPAWNDINFIFFIANKNLVCFSHKGGNMNGKRCLDHTLRAQDCIQNISMKL